VLANQNSVNLELIVIDGGSTDGTIKIIQKNQDTISEWVSEPDNGIYDAMNKGISKAHGEWIFFLNAGDTFCTDNTVSTFSIR
jgi:glycosyltransferase involved in cell wall biosynthesis